MRRSIRNRLSTSEPTTASFTSPPEVALLRARRWEKPTVCGTSRRSSRPNVHTLAPVEDVASRPPRRERPQRRPERQQIMLRRALALGGGLVLLILIVLGIKGCLDARANRELSDYARNVTQIVEETKQTSKDFFEKLEDPGTLSVTDYVEAVNADRSAVDTQATRVDDLSAPGDMGRAQSNLEL